MESIGWHVVARKVLYAQHEGLEGESDLYRKVNHANILKFYYSVALFNVDSVVSYSSANLAFVFLTEESKSVQWMISIFAEILFFPFRRNGRSLHANFQFTILQYS